MALREVMTSDLLTCPVCFEKYSSGLKSPKVLTCLHTLCHSCLQLLIDEGKTQDPSYISCPNCRERKDIDEDDTANNYRDNFTIKQLFDLLPPGMGCKPKEFLKITMDNLAVTKWKYEKAKNTEFKAGEYLQLQRDNFLSIEKIHNDSSVELNKAKDMFDKAKDHCEEILNQFDKTTLSFKKATEYVNICHQNAEFLAAELDSLEAQKKWADVYISFEKMRVKMMEKRAIARDIPRTPPLYFDKEVLQKFKPDSGRLYGILAFNNQIFVSDTDENAIHQLGFGGRDFEDVGFDSTPHKSIGKKGDGPVEFHTPMGLAVNSIEQLIIMDSLNKRFQVLSKDGEFISEFKTDIECPCGICIDDEDKIYVSSTYIPDPKVVIYKGNGELVQELKLPDKKVADSIAHYKGHLYAVDRENSVIHVVKGDGEYVKSIGEGLLQQPSGIAVDRGGNILVGDGRNKKICVLSGESGEIIDEFGERSISGAPVGIATTNDDNIVVCDTHGIIYIF